jgi:hypothetical protein
MVRRRPADISSPMGMRAQARRRTVDDAHTREDEEIGG